jgi:predicted AAA+ superfamily ATPase
MYLKKLQGILDTNQVSAITGARRSGKSFIMRQLAESLINSGRLTPRDILMVNLEDPRFTDLNLKLLQQIYEI